MKKQTINQLIKKCIDYTLYMKELNFDNSEITQLKNFNLKKETNKKLKLIIEAILEREKYSQLSPQTITLLMENLDKPKCKEVLK